MKTNENYVNLDQCLDNYNKLCAQKPAEKQKEHHLEFNDKVGWSVVEGKFEGTKEAKAKLLSNLDREYAHGFSNKEQRAELCRKVNNVLNNRFPELVEEKSPLRKTDHDNAIYLAKFELEHNPAGFARTLATKENYGLNRDELITIINDAKILASPLETQELIRNTELIKDIPEPERYPFLACLSRVGEDEARLIKYYMDDFK